MSKGMFRVGDARGAAAPGGRTRLRPILVLAGCLAVAALMLWFVNHETNGRKNAVTPPLAASASNDLTEAPNGAGRQDGVTRPSDGAANRTGSARRTIDKRRARVAPDSTHLQPARPAPGEGAETSLIVKPESSEEPGETSGESPPPEPEDDPQSEPDDDEDRNSGLAGWVFDEAGTGVPDLQVVATARRLARPSQTTHEAKSAKTDGEGYFSYPGLAVGEYALVTEATDAWESASGIYRTGENAAVLVVSPKADRRAVVRGYVEGRDGGSLTGVQVQPVGQFDNTAMSDDQGAYAVSLRLEPGQRSQLLRYQLEGYREHRLTIPSAELEPGSEVFRDVVLEPMRDTSTVSGFVAGTDGSPVHSAHVQLISTSLARRADGVSDRDGLFSISEVEHADDYRLWVRPPSGYKDYTKENLVVTGWVDLDIVLEEVEWATLEGRMVDPEGHPVAQSTLWLTTAQPREQRTTAVTGDDLGWFSVERLPEGRAMLATRAAPFLTFSGIELLPRETSTVRLRLDTGNHQLAGWVRDAGGRPVPLATARLLWSSLESGVRSQSRRDTVTDANGYFLFTRLGAGTHLLTLSADGFRSARLQVEVLDVIDELTVELVPIPE